jgi:F0F1-type ATP synthase epsilon subunit
MATRDKDGAWEFNDEESAQIEILARARVRADEIREERAAKKKTEDEAAAAESDSKKKKTKKVWGE